MSEPVLQSFRAHSSAVLMTHLCRDLLLGLPDQSCSSRRKSSCIIASGCFAPICGRPNPRRPATSHSSVFRRRSCPSHSFCGDVAQWSSALGNRPRLRCGAHVANRTVTFHGVARDAARGLDCSVHLTIAYRVGVVVPVEPVTSRVIQWQVRCHLLLSNLLPPMMSRGLTATWCIN